MGLKLKSFASALAIGFTLLAFGAASTAKADQIAVRAGYAPVAHYSSHGYYGHGHAYVRPYHSHYYAPYYRPYYYGAYGYPYPVVRVFVPFPFPHWVVRAAPAPAYPAYPAPAAPYQYPAPSAPYQYPNGGAYPNQ